MINVLMMVEVTVVMRSRLIKAESVVADKVHSDKVVAVAMTGSFRSQG